jgi:hypothetical protein
LVVYAGLCALVGGALIYALTRIVWRERIEWIDAYRPAFIGYAVALIVDGLRIWITAEAAGSPTPFPEPQTFNDVFSARFLGSFLGWLWPALPVAMLLLMIEAPLFRGARGVGRAAILSAVSLPGSLIVPLALLLALDERLTAIGTSDIGPLLLAIAVLIGLYAVLGALFAGPVLYFGVPLRHAGGRRALSIGRAYATAVLALAAWAIATWLVMSFLPFFDPYWADLVKAADASPVPTALIERPAVLLGGTLTFAVLQIPGMFAGERVVRRRLRAAGEPVASGRMRMLTAAAVLTTWPIVAAAAWIMAIESR